MVGDFAVAAKFASFCSGERHELGSEGPRFGRSAAKTQMFLAQAKTTVCDAQVVARGSCPVCGPSGNLRALLQPAPSASLPPFDQSVGYCVAAHRAGLWPPLHGETCDHPAPPSAAPRMAPTSAPRNPSKPVNSGSHHLESSAFATALE